ncbi:MAG: leucine-rich repeat domain-containing protein, partial [Firmicutes bacterium]|nr:leucine-rich repeat domain-containing protein [Bacillota bacterium]
MKLSKKKLLSFILALIMCIGVIPSEVFSSVAEYIMTVVAATDDVTASGTCGANLTWALTSDGTLTISGTGEMYNYNKASYVPWYSYRDNITAVVIEDGVASIGQYAFYDTAYYNDESSWENGVLYVDDWLTEADIDAISSDYSIKSGTIGIANYAFEGCTSLTSVTIPDSVKTIGGGAFSGCASLTSITIPDGVTTIGEYAFYGCESLTSITIPDSVTHIGAYAFWGCT